MPTVAHSPITSKTLPDTAATAHYLHPSTLPHCSHVAHNTSGPTVQVSNGHIIKTAFRATLQLSSKLSSKSQSTHVFKDITTGSLISMGQLCDDDCVVIFTKSDVNILKHNKVIITVLRDCTNGLWNIPLGPFPPTTQSPTLSNPNQANGILRQDINKRKLDQYFHAAAFIPVKSTLLAAIKNVHFTSWPGLSVGLISKNLTQSPFTVKFHLDQETEKSSIHQIIPRSQ